MTIHKDMFKNTMTSSVSDRAKIDKAFGNQNHEWPEGPLNQLMVEYVGTATDTEDVTAEMIVETMAKEFPEFLMAVAEENWILGYQQAIHDVDEGQKLLAQHAENEKDATT